MHFEKSQIGQIISGRFGTKQQKYLLKLMLLHKYKYMHTIFVVIANDAGISRPAMSMLLS